MRILLLALSVLFSTQIFAHTYIDPYQLKVAKERDKAVKEQCSELKSHYRQWSNCFDKIYNSLATRGTDEYSEAHYAHLSKAQADKEIKALFAIYKKASGAVAPHEKGEVTRTMMMNESTWIQNHIFKRDANWPFTLLHGKSLYLAPDEY